MDKALEFKKTQNSILRIWPSGAEILLDDVVCVVSGFHSN
jgi:hypothetical protein